VCCNSYALGDTIWFKGYVVNASNFLPDTLSGVLYAELLNEKGKVLETKKLKIADGQYSEKDIKAKMGVAIAIADKTTMQANKCDLVCVEADIIDSKGRFVPVANNLVDFEITGSYKLIGTENGDILDVTPAKTLSKKAFMGKLLLVLQATDEPGTLIIKAKSKGLQNSKSYIIKIRK